MRLWRPFLEKSRVRVVTVEMAKKWNREERWWEGVIDGLLIDNPSTWLLLEEQEKSRKRAKSFLARPEIKAQLDFQLMPSGGEYHGHAALLTLWLLKALDITSEDVRCVSNIDDKMLKIIAQPTAMKLILAGRCCAGCDILVQVIQKNIGHGHLRKLHKQLGLPCSDGIYHLMTLLPCLPAFLVRDVAKELEVQLRFRLKELILAICDEEFRRRSEEVPKNCEIVSARLAEAEEARRRRDEIMAEALQPGGPVWEHLDEVL